MIVVCIDAASSMDGGMGGEGAERGGGGEKQDGCAQQHVGCFDGLNGRVVSCGCGEGC